MRGVDLCRRSPLRRRREVAASAALFAVSPIAVGPRERPSPVPASEGVSSATAAPGGRRARLRLERAPRAGLTLRPQNTSLKNRITEQN